MGRHSKAVKLVGGVRDGFALLDDDECRWAIEAGERYIDDGIGFFRGTARPGTALMVAYVDEFRDRFRAGIGRDRPRPGDERHAGTGNPRRAPRRARPRGTRVRGGGAEPATPVLGLQDTGTDRNRVLREPSGASRPTIRAEQKTGHINVPDGTFAPPPRSVMRPGSQRLPAYSSWSIAPENTRFTAGRTTFSDGVRQEFS